MREVRWERMFPDELEEAFERCPLVYFTYGLCEPHGPHNAVGLDGIKAHTIACETAVSFGGIVAPPDFWHVHELGGYAIWSQENVGEVKRKWTTSIPPWVHFKNVAYHVRTADILGFHAALFITGHYGPNWEDLKLLLNLMQPHTKVQLFGLPDWEANIPGFDNDNNSGGDHAGKIETSLLWALDPACVDVSRLPSASGGADSQQSPPYFAMGPDAALSDRKIGQRMVADEVRWLSGKARQLLELYDEDVAVPGFPRFEDVEHFWDSEIRPRIKDFKSMSMDFGKGGMVKESSVWYENWRIPEGRS